jgi:hypothetical protein
MEIALDDGSFLEMPFIDGFWPDDEAWYAGPVNGKRGQGVKWRVEYNYRDVERLSLAKEIRRYVAK